MLRKLSIKSVLAGLSILFLLPQIIIYLYFICGEVSSLSSYKPTPIASPTPILNQDTISTGGWYEDPKSHKWIGYDCEPNGGIDFPVVPAYSTFPLNLCKQTITTYDTIKK